jgi:hypothetical protein
VVGRANGHLLKIIRGAIDGDTVHKERASNAAQPRSGVSQRNRSANGRRGGLQKAAHAGDRLLSMICHTNVVTIFVNHDGLVRIAGLRKRSEHGNGFAAAAESNGTESNDGRCHVIGSVVNLQHSEDRRPLSVLLLVTLVSRAINGGGNVFVSQAIRPVGEPNHAFNRLKVLALDRLRCTSIGN